ncbi:hypothetical protein KC19_7G012100 [Ceratodon purpureus]|uniref:Uncharacterized protein n=1 Tax=Ceratodon purpureus TaxID=3225 RepID=A0A8T0H3H2_CERPU|nr:hypothetical protein KC19_7G012100 [Ceratodon purpureus]
MMMYAGLREEKERHLQLIARPWISGSAFKRCGLFFGQLWKHSHSSETTAYPSSAYPTSIAGYSASPSLQHLKKIKCC